MMDPTTKKMLLQLAIAVVPPLVAWFGLGFPVDRQSLAILATAEGSAVLAWLMNLQIVNKLRKKISGK
jgi:hypothetical protein